MNKRKRARDSKIRNRDDTEMEDEAGKGQEGEEDKGFVGNDQDGDD